MLLSEKNKKMFGCLLKNTYLCTRKFKEHNEANQISVSLFSSLDCGTEFAFCLGKSYKVDNNEQLKKGKRINI